MIFMNENILLTDRQTGRLSYLDIAKGIGIVLVVMGHCIPDASTPNGPSRPLFLFFYNTIYSFHMPLFFFIAGFLTSRKQMEGGRFAIMSKRARRLLVPYLFVGLCYAPLKLLLSQFANNPWNPIDLWKIVIGVNPNGELWFLYALFCVTGIAVIFSFRVSLIGVAVSALLPLIVPYMPLVLGNLFFFMLGLYMRQAFPLFFEQMRWRYVLCCGVIFVCGNYVLYECGVHWARMFTGVAGSFLCLYLSSFIAEHLKETSFEHSLIAMGGFSMDIYILSDMIKIPFRIIFWNKLHWYTPTFAICTVAALLLSYYMSKYFIRRNGYLKKFVLGM